MRIDRLQVQNDHIQQAQRELDVLQTTVGDIPDVVELQSAIHSLQWLGDDGA